MNKNKKRIILSSLVVLMVVALTYVVTNIGAWLTDTNTTGDMTFQIGEVKYELTGDLFGDIGYVVPGQDLADGNDLKIKNASNVDSNLRIKIEFTYGVNNQDAFDLLLADEDGFKLKDDWKDSEDGFYYLKDTDETSGKIASDEFTTSISIVEKLVLDGSKVGNTFSNTTFTLKITFYAKQADHLNWSEVGNIDFSTGLAN